MEMAELVLDIVKNIMGKEHHMRVPMLGCWALDRE